MTRREFFRAAGFGWLLGTAPLIGAVGYQTWQVRSHPLNRVYRVDLRDGCVVLPARVAAALGTRTFVHGVVEGTAVFLIPAPPPAEAPEENPFLDRRIQAVLRAYPWQTAHIREDLTLGEGCEVRLEGAVWETAGIRGKRVAVVALSNMVEIWDEDTWERRAGRPLAGQGPRDPERAEKRGSPVGA